MRWQIGLAAAVLAATLAVTGVFFIRNGGLSAAPPAPLTSAERALAASLSLNDLPPLPASASNAVADNSAAADLGKALFFDPGFSANGAVSCATCHIPQQAFQDNRPLGRGVGVTDRRTMPLAGVAYDSWFFWDGRRDSLWAQALAPVESPVEHDFTRAEVATRIATSYRSRYEALFGKLPDLPVLPAASPLGDASARAAWAALAPALQDRINRIFAGFGKAIAAYERSLQPVPSRFDLFAAGDETAGFSAEEIRGFRLFTGKAQCVNCHNGPRMTDDFFHNTAVPSPVSPPTDRGRAGALAQVQADPFNCLGAYSDAGDGDCAELRFMSRDPAAFERAFKTPSLRGVAARAPYMHAGQIETLAGVVAHYNRPPAAASGHREIRPLRLSARERAALVAFLKTL